jgi:DNA-binding MarR family transcriptional regulator
MPKGTQKFDPILEARRIWIERGWTEADLGMALVTSVARVDQINKKRIDAHLRPLHLTFARFELLRLLSFTRTGSLPLSKVGNLLQVHPTSVTNTVDRLEVQKFVERVAHETDRRMTLVNILPTGREIVETATEILNREVFSTIGLDDKTGEALLHLLTSMRVSSGDFPQLDIS